MMNFEKLLDDIIRPLIVHQDDLAIKQFEDHDKIVVEVMVNKEDIGRVIGKDGSIANSIRTICYAAAASLKKRVNINFDTYEE